MLTMQFCKSIHLIEVVQKSVYYLGSCTLKNSLISKYIPNAEWHNFEVLKRKALSICWGYTMMIWKLVQISGHSASFSYFWQSPSSTSHQQPLVSWKFGSLVLLFKTGSYLSQSLTYMCVYILVWFLWYYQQKQFWFSLWSIWMTWIWIWIWIWEGPNPNPLFG